MLFFIQYERNFDDKLFKMWLNHYKKTNLDFKIYVKQEDYLYFKNLYPYYGAYYTIDYLPPENTLQLTEMDFLFAFTRDDNDSDTMILSYNISPELFAVTDVTIPTQVGRIFHVPIPSKPAFTTFEIPDFILYKHETHQAFQKYGWRIGGKDEDESKHKCSENLVILNLTTSELAVEHEYYETNILYGVTLNLENKDIYFSNCYEDFMMNVIVNKERKYAIVWHPKCGCTTITSLFCEMNQISLEKEKQKSLNFHKMKYRYNHYLQDIEIIVFVRNPLYRFLSTFIDKHIYQESDFIFPNLDGYIEYRNQYAKDNIVNLCSFIESGGYISEHYRPISDFNFFQTYRNKLNYSIYRIEDGLNQILLSFFRKHHSLDNLNESSILNKFENSIFQYQDKEKHKIKERNSDDVIVTPSSSLKHLDKKEFLEYLNQSELNYDSILDDELISRLLKMYWHDLANFGYM
jgi:hypothetical protein